MNLPQQSSTYGYPAEENEDFGERGLPDDDFFFCRH